MFVFRHKFIALGEKDLYTGAMIVGGREDVTPQWCSGLVMVVLRAHSWVSDHMQCRDRTAVSCR